MRPPLPLTPASILAHSASSIYLKKNSSFYFLIGLFFCFGNRWNLFCQPNLNERKTGRETKEQKYNKTKRQDCFEIVALRQAAGVRRSRTSFPNYGHDSRGMAGTLSLWPQICVPKKEKHVCNFQKWQWHYVSWLLTLGQCIGWPALSWLEACTNLVNIIA